MTTRLTESQRIKLELEKIWKSRPCIKPLDIARWTVSGRGASLCVIPQ